MVFLRHAAVHLVIVVPVGFRVSGGSVVAVVLHVVSRAVIAFDVATSAVVRTKAHLVGAQRTTQSHANGATAAAATARHLLAITCQGWEGGGV